MSRIGRKPIEVPSSVSVSIDPGRVMVNGPLGSLTQQVPTRMKIEQGDGELLVTRPTATVAPRVEANLELLRPRLLDA